MLLLLALLSIAGAATIHSKKRVQYNTKAKIVSPANAMLRGWESMPCTNPPSLSTLLFTQVPGAINVHLIPHSHDDV